MNKTYFLFCFTCWAFFLLPKPGTSQQIIALHSGTISYFSEFNLAYEAANDGDTLYLPGGQIDLGGDFYLEKKLYLVGAGHHPDSSKATSITIMNGGSLYLNTNAQGGSLTGCYLNNDLLFNESVTGYTVRRCNLREIWLSNCSDNTCPNSSNTVKVQECIIRGNIYGAEGVKEIHFYNNLIEGFFYFFQQANLRIINNVFLGLSDESTFYIHDVSEAAILNNIFVSDSIYNENSSVLNFQNNIFTGDFIAKTDIFELNNIKYQPLDSIFDSSLTTDFKYKHEYSTNYALIPECKGKNAGIDGTDIGIFGGQFPYKLGGKPFNPHIQIKSLESNYIGIGGSLKLNIQVEAQSN